MSAPPIWFRARGCSCRPLFVRADDGSLHAQRLYLANLSILLGLAHLIVDLTLRNLVGTYLGQLPSIIEV